MKKCIICKKPSSNTPDIFGFVLCDSCQEEEDKIMEMMEKGIKLEYSDGSFEILKSDH